MLDKQNAFDLWSLDDNTLVTPEEVLEHVLRVSVGTLYRMEARGEFVEPVYPTPNRKFFRAGDLKKYLAGLATRVGVRPPERAKRGPKPKAAAKRK